jgi:hypothetical protein
MRRARVLVTALGEPLWKSIKRNQRLVPVLVVIISTARMCALKSRNRA